LNKSNANGLVRLIPNATTITNETINGFYGDDEPQAGQFLWVKNISGATGTYIIYPFKIVEAKGDNHALLLENLYSLYPGLGFSADPDGDYIYDLVKCVGAVILQYLGVDDDGYLEFDASLLSQLWEVNQWRDYYMHISYAQNIGSRTYFRIDHNTSNKIFCEDTLGNLSSLTLNYFYYCSIDLAMMKAQPDNLQPSSLPPGTAFSRNGNDIYSTEVTREQNTTISNQGWLRFNERGQSITLVMSRTDVDGDGL
jgi:hypothetical protein